ncbi:MAG TPA: hypothetical protein VIK04_14985, partial [Solirubrobacteraceae bacterium]
MRRRGLIAVAARGRVELLDLATCHLTVRRAMGATRVRFSPDGRWLAYVHPVRGNPGDVSVVPVGGGAPRSPLHGDIVAWSWARAGERLYGLTAGGSLVTASPRSRRRSERAPRGAPASVASFGLSPDGHRLAVNRSRCGRQSPNGELDTVNVRTGARVVALRQPGRYLTFAGWTADGRWLLYFPATQCSASLAADGWALDAVPAAGGTPVQAVGHMLLFDDLRSWCGQDLIAAAGPDRETETGSALVATAPPAWRERTIQPARRLSWTSPACAPSGRLLAAAAGPGNAPVTFGLEHRSIWLLRPGGRILRRL